MRIKNTLFSFILFLFLLPTLFLFSGCEGCGKSKKESEKNEVRGTFIPQSRGNKHKIMIDTAVIWVEVADEEPEREKGLMYRESMPEDEGMLFVFESPRLLSFWMKNTFIPLDIAYIDQNGFIVDVLHMKPEGGSNKPDEDLTSYPGSRPAIYALELNEGWFKKRGIGAGAKVRFN